MDVLQQYPTIDILPNSKSLPIPISQPHISDTKTVIIPLVAGNLIIPKNTNSSMPEICFRNGDGVTLICAECDNIDFNYLVMRNDERDCDLFYTLVPELKASSLDMPDSQSSDHEVSTASPVLALQVALFPGVGLSIGISNHHAVGDARSIFMFMKAWSICNFKLSHDKIVNESHLEPDQLPVFDRKLIPVDDKDIAKITCDQWLNLVSNSQGNPFYEATENPKKVRKTFIISSEDVKKLKNMVPGKAHVSSFVVICSYIWTCLVKSQLAGKTEGDRREHVAFSADCRERTDPNIPANYFGNCLTTLISNVLNGAELAEEGGFRMTRG